MIKEVDWTPDPNSPAEINRWLVETGRAEEVFWIMGHGWKDFTSRAGDAVDLWRVELRCGHSTEVRLPTEIRDKMPMCIPLRCPECTPPGLAVREVYLPLVSAVLQQESVGAAAPPPPPVADAWELSLDCGHSVVRKAPTRETRCATCRRRVAVTTAVPTAIPVGTT